MSKISASPFILWRWLGLLIGLSGLNLYAAAGVYDDFFAGIRRDNPAMVQSALVRGFDVNTLGPEGEIGLSLAFFESAERVIPLLMQWPATDVNALNRKGESALMLAAWRGLTATAQTLVEKGADINKTGWTPLHYAASSGQVAMLGWLLENHAYIDAQSPNGTTPLMMAAMYGTQDAVELLLKQGADASLTNQQGLSALDFAERGERPDAIKTLSGPAAMAAGAPAR